MKLNHPITRFLALFFCLALSLPSPVFALKPQEAPESAGLEEITLTLTPSAGMEKTAKSQNTRWRHVQERIVSALRNHTGGWLTTHALANLVGVNITTLRAHNYRSLVAAEPA